MSPRTDRVWVTFGLQVRDARLRKQWSVRELGQKAGLSPGMVYRVESGAAASTDTATKVAAALGQRAKLILVDPRRRQDARPNLSADPVHSAMGEVEARRLRAFHFPVGMDEPYQHFQFAGRADLCAWDLKTTAFLHIENRTRFPNFQEMAGSYNSKRAYLATSIGERVGVQRWASQTHVVAALWSAEVLHALRLRTESFRAICPDSTEAFNGWWSGQPPRAGSTSTLIVIDPLTTGRQRDWISLDETMTARPRCRGYAEAAAAIRASTSSVRDL